MRRNASAPEDLSSRSPMMAQCNRALFCRARVDAAAILVASARTLAGCGRSVAGLGSGASLAAHARTCSPGLQPWEAVMRQVEVMLHGHRVVCRVAGDPGLPVILLIHGITCSGATWDPVLPALAEHAHVIAPDLLGHGESDKPRADYSLGAFASGLRDLLECLGHERATVVGHSLGGGVAMQFAYQYFEYCERLVLVSSGGLGRELSLALRAATLAGAELVLPVIANGRVRDAGVAVARLLRWLPMRLGPSMAEVFR